MKPAYLKFASEKEAVAALESAGLLRRVWVAVPDRSGVMERIGMNEAHAHALKDAMELDLGPGNAHVEHRDRGDSGLDVIGPIDDEGWHVNWIGEALPESLAGFEVYPETPRRVFAGWSPEEIKARANLGAVK